MYQCAGSLRIPSFCSPERCHHGKQVTREDTSSPDTLGQAVVGVGGGSPSSIFGLMGTYQRQPVGIRVHLGVLGDVPIRHPRTQDAIRKQRLRNLNDWEYVRMGNVLGLADLTTKGLIRNALSKPLRK